MNTGLGPNFAAMVGLAGATTWEWISISGYGNTASLLPFYALSDPITVPVPEPSTLVLAALKLIALAAWGWRRKRRTWSQPRQ